MSRHRVRVHSFHSIWLDHQLTCLPLSPPVESSFVYPDADKRRPPVPTLSEKPQMATPTKKDFVSTNITTNVMSVPKKPSPAYVDTVRGSKQPLESSGLVPKYIKEKVGWEGRGRL